MNDHPPLLELRGVAKTFTLHLQAAARLEVVRGVTLGVSAGECVVLAGPSGTGKSSVLRMIYGNYRCDEGEIRLRTATGIVDIARASPREIVALRRTHLGYVSQFLRVIPRVSTIDLVSAAARTFGLPPGAARERAEDLLTRLAVPERLWGLPPATFSGGEQQRVNIAIGFAGNHSIVLLDEPTASLDAANRTAVVDLIEERKAQGKAILGIFHDEDVRNRVADRLVDIGAFASPGGARAPRSAGGRGCLMLVVGPSGAGKDTLIRAAAGQLEGDGSVIVARRSITRPRDAHEDHEPVSVEELEARRARGEVALSWSAHGLHYAIPRSIDTALIGGAVVVCNVSRGVVEAARRRYARVVVVEVTAPADVLAGRLAERGRETLADQSGRLQRQATASFAVDVRIQNTGAIEDGAAQLVEAIRSARATGA
jgi:alpha-D-ribose 1-methylphosphonate 5-triphosphate synthase subunit PhnL